MPLYFFCTMVQKKSKMTKNSNQGVLLRWQSGLKMTKNVIFSELQKPVPMQFLAIKVLSVKMWSDECEKHWRYGASKFTDEGAAPIFIFDGMHSWMATMEVALVMLTSTTKLFHRPSSKWSSNSTFKWLIFQRWI